MFTSRVCVVGLILGALKCTWPNIFNTKLPVDYRLLLLLRKLYSDEDLPET